MTQEEMRIEHINLWLWMAEDPRRHKFDWPGWARLNIDTIRDEKWQACCFACAQAREIVGPVSHLFCTACPIEWACEWCLATGSEYRAFSDARSLEKYSDASALALKISRMWLEVKP